MSRQKHTPGPWETSCLPNGTEWVVSVEGGDMLADLTGCPNEAANACLIAAAPEMLDALHDILMESTQDIAGLPREEALDLLLGISNIARAAIAKATGAQDPSARRTSGDPLRGRRLSLDIDSMGEPLYDALLVAFRDEAVRQRLDPESRLYFDEWEVSCVAKQEGEV